MSSAVPATDLLPAVRALQAGEVVAVPTDTVYGLAVDPSRAGATGRLFAVKGRPADVALPVLVADIAQAERLWKLAPGRVARRLAERFWPGPLTLVVARAAGIDWDLGGDPSAIGLRCPDHELVRRLCRLVGPLATTSANRHGEPPLRSARAVTDCFGAALPVIDGGECGGEPSTVVDATSDPLRCLRAGAVAWEAVLEAAR
ncbi:MAG TPA: L-threonylcarbamoyladenylate synthase [Acidimicrobiales bacterium]|nr:L-threonylcarbamoyladenylate synthase [Acidimicrobiales bacterium]